MYGVQRKTGPHRDGRRMFYFMLFTLLLLCKDVKVRSHIQPLQVSSVSCGFVYGQDLKQCSQFLLYAITAEC